jgi:hypothetical protein
MFLQAACKLGIHLQCDGGENPVVSQRLNKFLCGPLMLDNDDADKICAHMLNQGNNQTRNRENPIK